MCRRLRVLEGPHALPVWIGVLHPGVSWACLIETRTLLLSGESSKALYGSVGLWAVIEGFVDGPHTVRVMYYDVLDPTQMLRLRLGGDVSTKKYALVSTWDKAGVGAFAKRLHEAGYTLLSTGGTARVLKGEGLPVVSVADHTGSGELCDGRVKTLHPRVHAGILGDRQTHAQEVADAGIPWIDIVVCNLYPFEEVTRQDVDLATAVETIDIGGPTMVRAAAKNHRDVVVVVDPSDYDRGCGGTVPYGMRRELAVHAFRHVSRDTVVASWLAEGSAHPRIRSSMRLVRRVQELRYGENHISLPPSSPMRT